MRRMAAFSIPDHCSNVEHRFKEALERYAEGEYDGTSRMVLVMKGPVTASISGPDGAVAANEIIMTGYRNKKEPIRSDIAGRETERECLGTVMKFWFRPISRHETRVWASYREYLATVRALFEKFVTEKIEKWYPAVGSLWQKHEAELEKQRLEIIEGYLEMESGDAGAAASAIAPAAVDGGPVTKAVDAGAQPQQAGRRGAEEETPASSQRSSGVRQSQPWDDTTLTKLPRLRDIRRDAIERGVELGFTAACAQVPIDPKTARTHAPELRARWDDKTYDLQGT